MQTSLVVFSPQMVTLIKRCRRTTAGYARRVLLTSVVLPLTENNTCADRNRIEIALVHCATANPEAKRFHKNKTHLDMLFGETASSAILYVRKFQASFLILSSGNKYCKSAAVSASPAMSLMKNH